MKAFVFVVGILLITPASFAINREKNGHNSKRRVRDDPLAFVRGMDSVVRDAVNRPPLAGEEVSDSLLRVAVGYNSNLDLIIRALPFLQRFCGFSPQTKEEVESEREQEKRDFCGRWLSNGPKDFAELMEPEELLRSFSFFFRSGSAAERLAASELLWEAILEAARSLPEDEQDWFIGGNAALMATRFAKEDALCEAVLLGGHVGSQLRELLPEKVEVAGIPTLTENPDEIHLIMEYAKDELLSLALDVGESDDDTVQANVDDASSSTTAAVDVVRAPRANRYIVVRDSTNSKVMGLEPFHTALSAFEPSLVVIAGLHLLAEHTVSYREARLMRVAKFLRTDEQGRRGRMPRGIPFHLELASIADRDYMYQLSQLVVPRVDSLGLNEQELGVLFDVVRSVAPPDEIEGLSQITLDDFKTPNVETVLQALKFVFDRTRPDEAAGDDIRPLRRIHFHCLHFHVLLVSGKDAADLPWNQIFNAKAVAAGSVAASRQACDKDKLTSADIDLLVPLEFRVPNGYFRQSDDEKVKFSAGNPIVPMKADDGRFWVYVAPVAVCKKPLKTVGLGDAISAVSLLNHLK